MPQGQQGCKLFLRLAQPRRKTGGSPVLRRNVTIDRRAACLPLLNLDLRSRRLDFLFDLFGFLLGHAFLNGFGSAFN